MDTEEKEKKSVEQIIVNNNACVLLHRAASGTDKKTPNPNQEFALESDFKHLIFMCMTDLGEELELKGKGGEKWGIRPCVKNLSFRKERFPIWIMLVQEALQFFCILSWEAAFTQLLSCCCCFSF